MQHTTIPLRPGEKVAAVKWRMLQAGDSQPDRPDTQGRAVLTGARSGGLVIIDVDVRDDGFAYFERLEQHLGVLPPTRTVRTPSGGLHVYLRHADCFRSVARVHVQGLQKIKGQDGVDIRGEGGIAVLPDPEGGRGYVVEDDHPIAEMPHAWALALPKAGRSGVEPQAPELVQVEPGSLRQALADVSKGKRGDGWDAMRRAARGERMISIDGGPPDSAPLVHGVDDFLSKQVIFALASAEHDGFAWYRVPPEDMGRLFDPSLSILRGDVHKLGGESKFTAEHFAGKWEAAAAKVAGQVAETIALSFDLDLARAEAGSAADAGCPLIVQVERKFFVLDDRSRLCYEGPHDPTVLREMARKLWPDRPLDVEADKGGMRPMLPHEIMAAYQGEACGYVSLDYAATRPRVDDLTLVRCLPRPPIEPLRDPEVQAWLDVFAGDRWDMLKSWIVWAAPEKCAASAPALAMVNGAHVGKSLLAESLAMAGGQFKVNPLKQVLTRFAGVLDRGPIVFGDEGLPSINGKPATEEFRDLVTSANHLVEMKGLERRMEITGSVRVLLAANSPERLFSNTGAMSAHDVTALLRRLCVISIEGERIEESKRLAVALGAFENDPARRLRVAQHLRWLQVTHAEDTAQPQPDGGTLGTALRKGSDVAGAAIAALEDAADTGTPWLAQREGAAWVSLDGLARCLGDRWSPKLLSRALASYLGETARLRVNPATGERTEGARVRWTEIDLTRCEADGIALFPGSQKEKDS